jgi:hypothetical protein
MSTRRDVSLDAPEKSAAHTEHRPLACADAGLVNDRSGEEFERHLAQRHDHLLEIDPILGKERKAAARQVSKMDQSKVGLAGKSAVAKGRQKLNTIERSPVASAMILVAACRRRCIDQPQPLGLEQLMNTREEVGIVGG